MESSINFCIDRNIPIFEMHEKNILPDDECVVLLNGNLDHDGPQRERAEVRTPGANTRADLTAELESNGVLRPAYAQNNSKA